MADTPLKKGYLLRQSASYTLFGDVFAMHVLN